MRWPGRSGKGRFGQACSGGLLVLLAGASLATGVTVVPVRPFVDGDGDRVDDTIDQCLYSAPGAVVDEHGCSADNDQDGDQVPDNVDDCPYSPPGARVDARGCALDSDFDGVADGLDRCPDSELGAIVDEFGCASGQHPAAVPMQRPIVAAPQPKPQVAVTTPGVSSTAPAAAAIVMKPAPPVSPAPVLPTQTATVPAPIGKAAVPAPTVSPAASLPPSRPTVSPAPAPVSSALSVRYGKGSAALGAGELQILRNALPKLRQQLKGQARIVVQGYAEIDEGPNASTLARTRANRVRRFLEQNGFETHELSSVGLPAGKPASNAASDSMRRVDLVIESE